MRNREVKKVGGSLFIQLLKADVDDFEIVEGDKVDIEDLFLKQIKKNENKNTINKRERED